LTLEKMKKEGWLISELIPGAKGLSSLLTSRVLLQKVQLYSESTKFLEHLDDKAKYVNTIHINGKDVELTHGVFKCAPNNAIFDGRFACRPGLGSSKPFLFMWQTRQSEVLDDGKAKNISANELIEWYKTATKSMSNFDNVYKVVYLFVTNRRFSFIGTQDDKGREKALNKLFKSCPELLLISQEQLAIFLGPTLAHRGLLAQI